MQHTGRTGPSQKAPKHRTGLPSSKLTQTRNSSNKGWQRTHSNIHLSKNPTRVGTGQTGERHRSDQCGLGFSGWTAPAGQHPQIQTLISRITPRTCVRLWDCRNTSWGVHSQVCVHQNLQIKRNRRNPARNSSNPRTPKTPESSPLTHRFGRGIKGKRNHEGFTHTCPTKSSRARSRKHTKKSTKRGLWKSPPRTTGNNITKPWGTTRIIYTYQRGSYKV
jgi:hypothetical protein